MKILQREKNSLNAKITLLYLLYLKNIIRLAMILETCVVKTIKGAMKLILDLESEALQIPSEINFYSDLMAIVNDYTNLELESSRDRELPSHGNSSLKICLNCYKKREINFSNLKNNLIIRKGVLSCEILCENIIIDLIDLVEQKYQKIEFLQNIIYSKENLVEFDLVKNGAISPYKEIFRGNEKVTKLVSCTPVMISKDVNSLNPEKIISNFSIEILSGGLEDNIEFEFFLEQQNNLDDSSMEKTRQLLFTLAYEAKSGYLIESNEKLKNLMPKLGSGDVLTLWTTTRGKVITLFLTFSFTFL